MMTVRLSPLEREIAQHVAEGRSYAEVAVLIRWKPASVRVAIHRLVEKIPGDGSPKAKIVRWWYTQAA